MNFWKSFFAGFLGGTTGSAVDPFNYAASLESAAIAIIKDLTAPLIPIFEIIAGVLIIILTLGLAFKNDLMAVAGPVAAGAMI